MAGSNTAATTGYDQRSGPQTTATISASGGALVILTAAMSPIHTGTSGYMSFSVSGASSRNASDATALKLGNHRTDDTGRVFQASAVYFVTGLNAGGHTFTTQIKRTGTNSSVTFTNRSIIVIPF